jgi:hypothetical protein
MLYLTIGKNMVMAFRNQHLDRRHSAGALPARLEGHIVICLLVTPLGIGRKYYSLLPPLQQW